MDGQVKLARTRGEWAGARLAEAHRAMGAGRNRAQRERVAPLYNGHSTTHDTHDSTERAHNDG